MQPIIKDQYTAARVYFACVIGLLVFESCLYLPSYLLTLRRHGHPPLPRSRAHSKPYTLLHRLLTLPSPLPLLTNHTVANLLRLSVFLALNILFGYNRNTYSGDYRLYGHLTLSNGGLTLLLAARTNLLSHILRIPSSTLLTYHRWTGRATVIHATLHFALNTRLYLRTGQLMTAYGNTRIQVGIMAWLSLAILFVSSISFVRRRYFEVFYYPHFLFFVFVVGGCIHALHGPEFLLPGLGLWVVDRGLRFARNWRSVKVVSARQFAGDLTKLEVKGLKTRRPGQMAWVQVSGVSWANWHPFTVVAAPGDDVAVLAIRGLGGYTKTLQAVAARENLKLSQQSSGDSQPLEEAGAGNSRTSTIKLRIDGPHGLGETQWGLHAVTVLVAGGIGITPGMSIALHIVKVAKKSLEAGATGAEGCGQWHIHLLWIIKDIAHADWFENEFKELAAAADDPRIPVTVDIKIHVTSNSPGAVIQQRTRDAAETIDLAERASHRASGSIMRGRPNLKQYLNEIRNTHPGQDAVVNACGPRSMIREVRKAAATASQDGSILRVEEEVFEL